MTQLGYQHYRWHTYGQSKDQLGGGELMGDEWRDSFAPRGPPGLSSPVNTWRATATGEVAEVAGLRPRGFWARLKAHEFRQDRQIFLSKRAGRGRYGTPVNQKTAQRKGREEERPR